MDDRTVWITGAAGLIGSSLLRTAPIHAPAWRPRGLTRQTVDLTDDQTVRLLFQQDHPAAIIHCAALSRSVACEAQPALARKLNVDVTAHLSELAESIPFVFFSTDLVFDGRQGHYTEQASPRALTVYAETKLAAERVVLANPGHTVVRTSLNGGTSPSGDRGFNEQIRRAWEAGRMLRFFTDEFRSPLPAVVTAQAVWALLEAGRPGLYHLAGSQRLSRWEIGQLLAARWPQLHPRLEPGSLRDYAGPPRSPDTSLDCSRVQALLPSRLPGLAEWLATNPDVVF
ncbi:MAG: SDR family oxidoreductase [Verrucomicrobia bacterium]|nr:SDR family oxidoreductase [Verrucomicrobiota bacterium]